MKRPSTAQVLRLLVLFALVVLGVLVGRAIHAEGLQALRTQIAGLGGWGIGAFVMAYAVLTLVVVPKGVLSATAGALWGIWFGVSIVMVSATIGALVAFWIARVLGQDTVRQLVGSRLPALDDVSVRRSTLAVIVARLIPVMPFTVVNYAAGLSSVSVRSYLVGTVVGMVPGTVVYVAVGSYGWHPYTWPFAVAAFGVVAVTVLGIVLGRRLRGRPSMPSVDEGEVG